MAGGSVAGWLSGPASSTKAEYAATPAAVVLAIDALTMTSCAPRAIASTSPSAASTSSHCGDSSVEPGARLNDRAPSIEPNGRCGDVGDAAEGVSGDPGREADEDDVEDVVDVVEVDEAFE